MDPSAQPALSVSVDLAAASVRIAGELDRDTAHHLLDAVAVLTTRPARQWRLDVDGVTFCDVAGLRALNGAATLAAGSGRTLQVSRGSRPVARLVALVGPDRVLPPGRADRRLPHPRVSAVPTPRWGTTGTA